MAQSLSRFLFWLLRAQPRTHLIRKIRMDMNHASNGIFLPEPDPLLVVSRHRGSHKVYNDVASGCTKRCILTFRCAALGYYLRFLLGG
ncbi:AHH domain-containing protein [Paenibacillus thiaminolyticus]|uniref:AHH domain-containing protein n=1 Tax=Paenibacillus thiaminolyticus TaxID=49283 RepID=UPI0035A58438